MAERTTRRRFLQSAALGGTALGVGSLAFLKGLPPVSAQDARVSPPLVTLDAGIEPLVRLIEETPQSDLWNRWHNAFAGARAISRSWQPCFLLPSATCSRVPAWDSSSMR